MSLKRQDRAFKIPAVIAFAFSTDLSSSNSYAKKSERWVNLSMEAFLSGFGFQLTLLSSLEGFFLSKLLSEGQIQLGIFKSQASEWHFSKLFLLAKTFRPSDTTHKPSSTIE